MTGKWTFPPSEMEEVCGYLDVHGFQSFLIEPIAYDSKANMVKQFQRALRILKLKPYVHPSQLSKKVSATSSDGGDSQSIPDEIQAEKANQRAKGELALQ